MKQIIKKSYAKVNIFLKISKKRQNYHEIVSRFARVNNLFDYISIKESNNLDFTINGSFGCNFKSNTIYKAYKILAQYSQVKEFFKNHSVYVQKNIPEFSGLGGGSSNAASFLLLTNELCNLNLSKKQLCEIGIKIGADVPFFIYEYNSANVTGIGEIVEEYQEEILNIETFTPNIKCNTGEIFKIFRQNFYKEISLNDSKELLKIKSKQILKKFDIFEANDLYKSALFAYPSLKKFEKKDWFFSGSGSSFFRIDNVK